jgi:hypothetical protein
MATTEDAVRDPDIGPFEMMSQRENQHTGIPAKALEEGRKSE